ncbi:hypothetical protein [Metabacillus fastidiosus]|uniref:hypothetical protein n=1 Tax=Metabacillus fastidiosus TaxID=1458 RepID=UPI002DB9CBA0|nr:hypothetical protein [Metabacillus fastidiosus]MEC2075316.1 hypothetical protein [Metabacillus fastidiosus]
MKKTNLLVITSLTGIILLNACSLPYSNSFKGEPSTANEQIENEKKQPQFENVDQFVQYNAELLWDTWEHTDQVWPGSEKYFEKLNRDIFLTDMENCWIVKKDRKIEKKSIKELPQDIQKDIKNIPPFGEINYDGKMMHYVKFADSDMHHKGKDVNRLHRVLMHETFHGYQGEWKRPEGTGFESPSYNELLSARQCRLEMIKALQQALEHPKEKQQHLEAAAWWYQKYKKEHPREYKDIQLRDQKEGTAKYFDTHVSAYGDLGINAPQKEINNWMIDYYKESYKGYLTEYMLHPGDEVYFLHSRASLLLDILQDKPHWKQDVEKGKLPLDLLLDSYKPVPQQPSPELKQIIETLYNDKVKPGMEQLLDGLNKQDSVYLVTNQFFIPSYTIGLFRTNEFKTFDFAPFIDGTLSSDKGKIQLKGGSYISGVLDDSVLDPDFNTAIPLPKDIVINEENTTLQVDSERMKLDIKYDKKYIGKDGKTYFVVDMLK